MSILFLLLVSHAVCDYPLQGDFLAKLKDPWGAFPRLWWVHGLTAHALIHAGGVYLVTGSLSLALAEFVLHWLIDLGKCAGGYGLHLDQFLHVMCKVVWFAIIVKGLAHDHP